MNECVICGDAVPSRGKTCSAKCRKALSRRSVTKGVTSASVTKAEPVTVTTGVRPMNWGLPNCACRHCRQVRANGSKHTLNHGPYKRELGQHELNRVSLPGDVDYNGVCLDAKYDSHRAGIRAGVM